MNEIERDLQKELFICPECGEDVHTVAAEGVPAQQLRDGSCGHRFFMDFYSVPRYLSCTE
jgi:hypothetical protein